MSSMSFDTQGTHVYRTRSGFWVYATPNVGGWEFFETLPCEIGIPGDVISIGPKPDTNRPPSSAVQSSAVSWEEFLESPGVSPDFFVDNGAFVFK